MASVENVPSLHSGVGALHYEPTGATSKISGKTSHATRLLSTRVDNMVDSYLVNTTSTNVTGIDSLNVDEVSMGHCNSWSSKGQVQTSQFSKSHDHSENAVRTMGNQLWFYDSKIVYPNQLKK